MSMELIQDRNYRKGDVIASIEPDILFSSSPLQANSESRHKSKSGHGSADSDIHICRVCGKSIAITNSHGIHSMHSLPHFNGGDKKRTCILSDNIIDKWGWTCCSIKCQEKSSKLYSSVCACPIEGQVQDGKIQEEDQKGASEVMSKFFRYIFPKKSKRNAKAKESLSPSPASMDDIALLAATILQQDAHCMKKFIHSCHDTCLGTETPDRVMECWTILKSDMYNRGSTSTEIMSGNEFCKLYQCLRQRNIHTISIHHPLVDYITKTLLTLSDDELEIALSIIHEYIPGLETSNEKMYNNKTSNEVGSQVLICARVKGDNEDANDDDLRQKVLMWRKATRLVQAINGNIEDDEDLSSLFDQRAIRAITQMKNTYFALCSDLNLEHSCVPNCIVESSHSTSPSSSYEGGDAKVKVYIVALHDIEMGEIMTISRIDNLGEDVESRQKQLRVVYGPTYQCQCPRCQCERWWDRRDSFRLFLDPLLPKKDVHTSTDLAFRIRDMRRIADLAMQHSNYRFACNVYSLILKVQKHDNGDILHARCASYLERGRFEKAQKMWSEAYQICPSHEEISLQMKKQRAYMQMQISGMETTSSSHLQLNEGMFTTLIPKKCFKTTHKQPLLSPEECSQAIKWAEEAAESRVDGWTTSRHYAVPTTDIPIHEIPKVLHWFNELLNLRLRPLLAKQFGEDDVGINGSGVYIHDAFVVRYDATSGQKHLPLHRDQSSHSFTIALNSLSDYDGGGTYIADLKRSIRPDLGGAVSFRGDQLLHGGDPVVRGVRYIIVAFCYVSKKEDACDEEQKRKKMKLDGIFKKQDGAENTGFSFGFNF